MALVNNKLMQNVLGINIDNKNIEGVKPISGDVDIDFMNSGVEEDSEIDFIGGEPIANIKPSDDISDVDPALLDYYKKANAPEIPQDAGNIQPSNIPEDDTIPQLSAAEEQTPWQRFRSWMHTPNISPEKAANIIGLSETFNVTPSQALKNYDHLRKNVFDSVNPTVRETAGNAMEVLVAGGLITHPITTVAGVATFMGIGELLNFAIAEKKGKKYRPFEGLGLSDYFGLQGLSKDAIDLAEFIGLALATGGAHNIGKGIVSRLSGMMPDKVKVSFINKVAKDVKEKDVTLEEAAVDNATEFGISDSDIAEVKLDISESQNNFEANIKSNLNNPTNNEVVNLTDVVPDYTFTSKKGNYFEKIGDKWYSNDGKLVDNSYVIKAAEKGKERYTGKELEDDLALIKDIEDTYNKRIEEITDKEIEDYYIKKETEAEQEIDYFGEKDSLEEQMKAEAEEFYKDIEEKPFKFPKEESGRAPIDFSIPRAIESVEFVDKLNKENPGNAVRYDGVTETGLDSKPYLYQFTAYDGPAKGDTFATYDPTFENIKIKLQEKIDARVPKTETKVEQLSEPKVEQVLEGYENTIYGKTKYSNDINEIKKSKEIDKVLDVIVEAKKDFIGKTRASIDPAAKGKPVESDTVTIKLGKKKPKDFKGTLLSSYDKTVSDKLEIELLSPTSDYSNRTIAFKFATGDIQAVHLGSRSGAGGIGAMKQLSKIGKSDLTHGSKLNMEGVEKIYILDADRVHGNTFHIIENIGGRKAKPELKQLPEPKETKPDITKHPLYQNSKTTETFSKIFENRKIDDIEVYTQKLINDVNKWYHGRRDIDTGKIRNALEEMEKNIPELRDQFITSQDHLRWSENVKSAIDLINEIKKPDGTTFYDIGGAIGEAVKTVGRYLIKKVKVTEKPSKPFTNVRELGREKIIERRARLSEANYDTAMFINKLEQQLTPEQMEVMPFIIEKTRIPKELGRPDLQTIAKKDIGKLNEVAKEIKQHFESGWEKVKANTKDLSVKQIEDYVTHLWEIPRHKKAEAVNWFRTQSQFEKKRFILTYKEGIEKGFKPKTLNIAEIIKTHDNVSNRAIENRKFINEILKLKQDNIHLVQRSSDAPLDWIEVDYPALTRRIPLSKGMAKRKGEFVKELKVRVHPDLVRPLKAIFEQRFDHPAISAYEAINGVMKKTALSASLFHHGALAETGIALMGIGKTAKIFNPAKLYKALVKGEYDIYTKEPLARDSIQHGVQYGPTADIAVNKIQGYLNSLARNTKDKKIIGRLSKLAANTNSIWDKALWNYMHDTLKLYGYEHLVSKLPTDLNTRQSTMAKREIAQFVNDTFGGQNWDTLMLSPKEVQMMTWGLLSADWTASTTRQALSPTGIGKIYKETIPLRRKLGNRFWLKAALYFGIGINALNVMFRNHDIKNNPQYYQNDDYTLLDKTMYGNTIGKKTSLFLGRYNDGSERYLKWGKQFRELFELLNNPRKKLGGKAAPLPQFISEYFTGHSLSGFKNDDIYGNKGLKRTLGVAKTLGKSALPISIRRYLKEKIEFHPLDLVMQSSKGMSRYQATDYFKQAIIDNDLEMIEDIYTQALRNNLPAYTLFERSLSWIEGEIVSNISKNAIDREDVKNKLSIAENAFDKRRYAKLLGRLEKEEADKRAGLRLLKSALQRAKNYRDLNIDSEEINFE